MKECQVIPFPLKARVGKVRRVAEVLRNTSNKATRESYWWRTVAQLREKLEELGLPDERIRHQIREFRSAVQAECLGLDVIERKEGQAPEGAA